MPGFTSGVIRFQNEVFPIHKDLFERLSLGQNPEALFITCSDSRIETAMITQTEPGNLFVCRNPGNIVPPHTKHIGGTSVSIEIAMSTLQIPHIVICGHTDCAAMKASIDPDSFNDLDNIQEWLTHTRAAVKIVNETAKGESTERRNLLLIEQNVVLQLQHLRTHPSVATRLAEGDLTLHGWVYDIKTGTVRAYDSQQNRFVPVSDFYAEEVAAEAAARHQDR